MKLPPDEKLARELFRHTARVLRRQAKWKDASVRVTIHWRTLANYVNRHFERRIKK